MKKLIPKKEEKDYFAKEIFLNEMKNCMNEKIIF
jgi:hypothetical protein